MFSPGWPARAVANGVATYVATMREALQAAGHHVVVLAPKAWIAPGVDDGVAALAPDAWFRLRAWCRRRLAPPRPAMDEHGEIVARCAVRVVRRHRLDVLEMEEAFGFCAEVAAAVPVPVVVKLHGPAFLLAPDAPAADADATLRVAREGAGIAAAAAVLAPSAATLTATLARYGVQPRLARRVPNPLVVPAGPTWSPAGADPDRVLYIGRYEPVKGGDLALEAFTRVLARRPQARLWFVGHDRGVPGPDGRLRHFAAHVAALPPAVQERIDYLGVLPVEQLASLRLRAGVVLAPSRFETQSYAALEAMALGCPVVAFAVGGLAEIVRDGATGLAVAPGDVAALADAALRVLADPALAGRLGSAARAYVMTAHDPAVIARATAEVYAAAIAARG